jgi:hypothetical protein
LDFERDLDGRGFGLGFGASKMSKSDFNVDTLPHSFSISGIRKWQVNNAAEPGRDMRTVCSRGEAYRNSGAVSATVISIVR